MKYGLAALAGERNSLSGAWNSSLKDLSYRQGPQWRRVQFWVRTGAGSGMSESVPELLTHFPSGPTKNYWLLQSQNRRREVEGRIVRFFLRIRIVFGRNL